MKILFINPANKDDGLFKSSVKIPPLSLATVAAMTPDKHEVTIVDENVEKINYDNYDLVALTCMTAYAPRVYNISKKFMRMKVPTIIGGIHPTMRPEEAMKNATSVVIGETESSWNKIIEDVQNNKLARTYHHSRTDLSAQPLPRRDLFKNNKYIFQPISTTRGCPFDCHFCSVTQFNGGAYRFRPISEVDKEISQIKSRYLHLNDDNIVGSGKRATARAVKLFRMLREHDKLWAGQASINIASDDKILSELSNSGCRSLLLGIESFNPAVLREMNKGVNLRYDIKGIRKQIKKIHDYGISVNAGIIFGNDHDTANVFDDTLNLISEVEFDRVMPNILTPYPGTQLFEKLSNDKRIIFENYPKDWRLYNTRNVVFQPQKMKVRELEEGVMNFYKDYMSLFPNIKKAIKTAMITKSLLGGFLCYKYNRRAVYYDYRRLKTKYQQYTNSAV